MNRRVEPEYVALGSSFAAGIGLGPQAPASPCVCSRTLNGYPQHLARMRGLSLVDRTCSGATTKHVLSGGQYFQGPQLAAVDARTRLVTLTAGGNDVFYVGDLGLLAEGERPSLRTRWKRRGRLKPYAVDERDFAGVRANMSAIIAEVRRRAPAARVVLATYPTILPPEGTCDCVSLSADEAASMREVGARLAEATREVAREGGAILVDMEPASAAHHACADEPWVNGWRDPQGAPFHPTLAGAIATANAIGAALDRDIAAEEGKPNPSR